jgi:hypothetical protein
MRARVGNDGRTWEKMSQRLKADSQAIGSLTKKSVIWNACEARVSQARRKDGDGREGVRTSRARESEKRATY